MPKPLRQKVCYESIPLGDGALVVEKLHRKDTNLRTATAVRKLMSLAYAAQFELPEGTLPPGAITDHLLPNTRKGILAQHGRMSSHMAKGSEYWLVWSTEDPRDLYGLAKVSPRGVDADTPFGYFNDIVVRPDMQHRGLGTVLVHAALWFGPAPKDAPLALEGFGGSSVNKWFQDDWKMVARGIDQEGLRVGPHKLPQIRYITESGLTVAGIVQAFEERVPDLTYRTFIES